MKYNKIIYINKNQIDQCTFCPLSDLHSHLRAVFTEKLKLRSCEIIKYYQSYQRDGFGKKAGVRGVFIHTFYLNLQNSTLLFVGYVYYKGGGGWKTGYYPHNPLMDLTMHINNHVWELHSVIFDVRWTLRAGFCATHLQCYKWPLYILNFNCQKWLLNRQERLELIILVTKSEFFTLTALIFITQSERDVLSCTCTFYDLCLTMCLEHTC